MTSVKAFLRRPEAFIFAVAIGAVIAGPGTAEAASADKPPASQDQAQGKTQRTETTVYGGWTVICNEIVGGTAKPECAAELRVVNPSSNTVVVFWRIANTGAGALTSTIQTPTGVKVNPGVELALGNAKARKIDFDSCSPQNCEAVAPLDPAAVAAVGNASDVTFTVTATDGRQIHFQAPLSGAKDALAALKR